MKNFKLYQPETIEEAVDVLNERKDYHLLAGGTDLMLRWKHGQIDLENLVNLKRIEELNFINFDEEGLEIGALVSVNQLIENQAVQEHYPALLESALEHSSPLTRNLATVVGNICNASPAADLIPALLVYDAKLRVRKKEQEILLRLKDFFVGPGQTKLEDGDFVLSVILPAPVQELKSSFLKEGKRKAHEIAIVNSAVSYIDKGGNISGLKVALGGVAPTPLLLDLDWFDEISENNLNKLVKVITDSITPITDQRSTDWYRKEVTGVLVKRAIKSAD
ncbi:xanthine dehydrogenase family protein subunit M [Natroniella sulfidigena]|uniref:FAD binding domain-containing protein n=1 Tax=Natroniella sulfidigena TaxID=723921 RepID=UPI002009DEE3|nr:xanthine dehydrogenase family protein subunit M [Natroniella sulfidigena]MCK8817585.1 xanthine dehydrogenase family protein subunit M [Natroniella sulfidigena]